MSLLKDCILAGLGGLMAGGTYVAFRPRDAQSDRQTILDAVFLGAVACALISLVAWALKRG